MGTFTAQMLVGTPHNFHGGIQPTHTLYLSENDRPAWILLRHDPLEPESSVRIATWIPSVDNMLEDGLTMIAAHIVRAESVLHALGAKASSEGPVALLTDIPADALSDSRSAARSVEFPGLKAILTVLPESTIATQLGSLEGYDLEIVVAKAG